MGMLSDGLAWLRGQLHQHAAPEDTVDLCSRTGEGTYADAVPWLAYPEPAQGDDLVKVQAQVGKVVKKFALWREQQAVLPKPLDRIVFAGTNYIVKIVDDAALESVFDCLCLKEV